MDGVELKRGPQIDSEMDVKEILMPAWPPEETIIYSEKLEDCSRSVLLTLALLALGAALPAGFFAAGFLAADLALVAAEVPVTACYDMLSTAAFTHNDTNQQTFFAESLLLAVVVFFGAAVFLVVLAGAFFTTSFLGAGIFFAAAGALAEAVFLAAGFVEAFSFTTFAADFLGAAFATVLGAALGATLAVVDDLALVAVDFAAAGLAAFEAGLFCMGLGKHTGQSPTRQGKNHKPL